METSQERATMDIDTDEIVEAGVEAFIAHEAAQSVTGAAMALPDDALSLPDEQVVQRQDVIITPHRCEGVIRSRNNAPCLNTAVVNREGQWFCKMHDPEGAIKQYSLRKFNDNKPPFGGEEGRVLAQQRKKEKFEGRLRSRGGRVQDGSREVTNFEMAERRELAEHSNEPIRIIDNWYLHSLNVDRAQLAVIEAARAVAHAANPGLRVMSTLRSTVAQLDEYEEMSMSSMINQTCQHLVHDYQGGTARPCRRAARFVEGGKTLCDMHTSRGLELLAEKRRKGGR